MGLVLAVDAIVVVALCWVALRRGVEAALPLAAFFLILAPSESQIQLPGLFDLTTQRVVVLTLLLLYVVSAKKSEDGRPLPLRWCLLLLVLWWLISAANSVVPVISIKTVLSQVLDFTVVYYIFFKCISRKETVTSILYALIMAMLVCSVCGAVEAYTGWQIISIFPASSYRFGSLVSLADRGIRVQSTFSHSILYGAALAMLIPVALYLISTAETRGRKAILWLAVVLMFLNIYKTGSRGPWIACLVSCTTVLLFSRPALKATALTVVLVTCIVLVARPGIWHTIADLYGETLNPDTAQGESYQWRYVLFDVAKRELATDGARALWGFGPESFYYLGIKTEFEGHIVKVDSCDSSVVAILIETGYVGLFIAALLFARAAYLILRKLLRATDDARDLYLVLLAGLFVFCFMMTNVAILGWGQQSYLLWMIIPMALAFPHSVAAAEANSERVGTIGRAGADQALYVPLYGRS